MASTYRFFAGGEGKGKRLKDRTLAEDFNEYPGKIMLKALFRDRSLLILLLFVLFIKLFSLRPSWIERMYTSGIYPVVSGTLRALFGWVPFSLGDVIYIAVFGWVLLKVWKAVKLLRSRQFKSHLTGDFFRRYGKRVLLVYAVFNLCWGLNYNREGILKQLALDLRPYTREELLALTTVLQQKLTKYAGSVDSAGRLQYRQSRILFSRGIEAYEKAGQSRPFLRYSFPSLKASLLTPIGNWFGFTGYYNPFTGEAQLKTDIPLFLKPFVVTHEMGHQLGYAKENEANFVAYLTCKASGNVDFLYSAYFELYRDALVEYAGVASKAELAAMKLNVPSRVAIDVQELRLYFLHNKNFIEPFMSAAYENYLKLNNQPKGHRTYSEVIAYLIAYMNKFGRDAI